ncbi:efflux RND transporter periplasmic adaptor subunit [Phocaeicola coprophilus]|nr:efflux RND transporter periplasmic adaptor subunit [Phocaeicola coprophilus]
MNNKQKLIAGVIAVAVIAGGGYWLFGGAKKKNLITFSTTQVKKSDISTSITATGNIEPVTEVEVGTQVSGIIDKIYVDYNSVVKEGQLIAEMDKVPLQNELESAKGTYDGAKAEFEYQERNYKRNQQLHEKGLISDTEYEENLYNYQRAKSSLESSRAAYNNAQRNLSYAIITSPINGVVTSRDVEEGQTVASGFETPTLFTIAADLTKMQVVVDVDEADIGGVKEGQRVTFTVDAYPEDTFEGRVTQVRLGSSKSSSTSSTSTSSETVVTYEVVISADNPDLKLKPRLTANVNIYTLDKKGVLCVPSKALRFIPEQPMLGSDDVVEDCEGEHKVWTYENHVFKAHPVTIGLSDGINTEILGGVEEGLTIVSEAETNMSANVEESSSQSERSPFMPGPPDRDKNKKNDKK